MIMLDLASLNWWLIGVAVLTASAAGALWYSSLLFGNQWVRAMKLSKKELRRDGQTPNAYLMSIASNLVIAIVVAELVYAFGATTLIEGIKVGLLVGAALVAFQLVHNSFKGSKLLALINGGYDLMIVLLMAGILAAWR